MRRFEAVKAAEAVKAPKAAKAPGPPYRLRLPRGARGLAGPGPVDGDVGRRDIDELLDVPCGGERGTRGPKPRI